MQNLNEIIACLEDGGVVLLPTDTVYGLAAKPELENAVAGIYSLKARPRNMNLPIMISSSDQMLDLGLSINEPTKKLLSSHYVPGALTMVVGFNSERPRPVWLEGRDEVAVRMPDDALLLSVIQETGPLLVTSANRHKSAGTPNNVPEILEELAGKPDLIVDRGVMQEMASSIINCRKSPPELERVGELSSEQLLNFLAQ
ncbi:MAG: L-threonylcarbamoyladenylate synthase [Bacteroidota bacterium]